MLDYSQIYNYLKCEDYNSIFSIIDPLLEQDEYCIVKFNY